MNTETPTRIVAEWAAGVADCAGGRAGELAREAWLDVCACMVAGADDEATLRVEHGATAWGSGQSSVVGTEAQLPPPAAAFVNGTAAHARDFDDNYHPTAGHASAVLVPAIIAVAERVGASGRQALDAYVIGLEVAAVIGEGVGLAHYERGWHSTSTIGAMAAAAACGRLLHLDADAMQQAIGVGFSFASGSKRQFGTQAKPMHAGAAAMHGVMAADLAAAGVSATPEPLEGPWSFRDLFAGDSSPGFTSVLQQLGRPLAIERYGLKAKIHPCCASVHCAVDAVADLMLEHRISPDEVLGVEAVVAPMSYHNLMYPRPTSEMQARFSMHYAIALAVLQGQLRLSDFSADAVARPNVRDWLSRVEMRMPREGERITELDDALEPAEVTLSLAGGRVLTHLVQHPVGTLERPMSPEQLVAKLADCVGARLRDGQREQIRSLLLSLDEQTDLNELTGLLRGVARL